MNKLTLIMLTLLLILIPTTLANTQVTDWGVTRDNSFVIDETSGVWTGRTAVTYTQASTLTSPPLIADLDQDGTNEILVMSNDTVRIYNYTAGTGLVELANRDIGSVEYDVNTYSFYPVPGIIDVLSNTSTDYKIIITNRTHVITLQYDGTSITENQSAATGFGEGAGSFHFTHPVIKCAPANQWLSNNITCAFPMRNRTANSDSCVVTYDYNANLVHSDFIEAQGVTDNREHNTVLADGDADGYLEIYFVYEDGSNYDLEVFSAEVASTGAVTGTKIYTHALAAANTEFGDIIVNNLEPDSGLEITWSYSDGGVNWDACTIDADGTLKDCSYCTALTCPEGEMASENMIEATGTTYCTYVNDVYYYVRNAANNDPGTNTDTIHCISRYAGSGTRETTVASTVNFTEPFYIHQADLYGSTGILTSSFGVQGGTRQSRPVIATQSWIVPVDYQQSGSLDLIGVVKDTRITYYDDAYTNQNWDIDSLEWDTGNPVCEDEIITFTLGITDNESDTGNCFITEKYGNNTAIANHSNTTGTAPLSMDLYYLADTVGTFLLDFNCRDQYHDNGDYTTRTYTVQVSNDTTSCLIKGEGGGSEEYVSDEEAAEEAQFDSNVDDVFADIGIVSDKAKSMFWLLIMIAVAFVIFKLMAGAEGLVWVLAVVEVMMLVLGWTLGMIGATVLVIVGLLCALLITLMIFKGKE